MANQSVRVIQITDCHLLADEAAKVRGWCNQTALNALLVHVRDTYPAIDAVLLTGDLAQDESPATYRRLTQAIQSLNAPLVCALPGNHDNPQTMHDNMPGVITTGPVELHGWRIHLLNSRIPGSNAGRIGTDALAALEYDLSTNPQAPALISVHHPPIGVGAAWLDAMKLADEQSLMQMMARYPHAHTIVCGHIHQSQDIWHENQRILCTPAVTRQFKPGSHTFAEDTTSVPGYRALRLFPDGRLTTRVHRVPAAKICG